MQNAKSEIALRNLTGGTRIDCGCLLCIDGRPPYLVSVQAPWRFMVFAGYDYLLKINGFSDGWVHMANLMSFIIDHWTLICPLAHMGNLSQTKQKKKIRDTLYDKCFFDKRGKLIQPVCQINGTIKQEPEPTFQVTLDILPDPRMAIQNLIN